MNRWRTLEKKTASQVRYGNCVYVVFSDGKPHYVGKTRSLYYRLHSHRTSGNFDFKSDRISVKFSFDRRFGEHAMREIRLIAKLNPPLNKDHRLSPHEIDNKPWAQAA